MRRIAILVLLGAVSASASGDERAVQKVLQDHAALIRQVQKCDAVGFNPMVGNCEAIAMVLAHQYVMDNPEMFGPDVLKGVK